MVELEVRCTVNIVELTFKTDHITYSEDITYLHTLPNGDKVYRVPEHFVDNLQDIVNDLKEFNGRDREESDWVKGQKNLIEHIQEELKSLSFGKSDLESARAIQSMLEELEPVSQ